MEVMIAFAINLGWILAAFGFFTGVALLIYGISTQKDITEEPLPFKKSIMGGLIALWIAIIILVIYSI